MKIAPIILLLCVGCTSTEVVVSPSGPTQSGTNLVASGSTNAVPFSWTLRRRSFLQRMEIPLLQIHPNGTVELQGYRTDGGVDAAAAVAAASVTAAIKSAKP